MLVAVVVLAVVVLAAAGLGVAAAAAEQQLRLLLLLFTYSWWCQWWRQSRGAGCGSGDVCRACACDDGSRRGAGACDFTLHPIPERIEFFGHDGLTP